MGTWARWQVRGPARGVHRKSAMTTSTAMQAGVALAPRFSTPDEAEAIFQQIAAAADAGADLLMFGDKHTDEASLRSNAVLLGAVLGRQLPISAVGLLYLATEWPEHLFLETARTIADLAHGQGKRSFFAVALGRAREAPAVSASGPRARVRELESRLASLGTDPATSDSELWIPAERGAALRRAGRLAHTWLANAHFELPALREQVEGLRVAATDRPSLPVLAVRRDLICATTDEEADRWADEAFAAGYRGDFPRSALIAGGARSCAAQLDQLREAGFTRVLVRPVMSGPRGVESLQRFFRDVVDR